ncbi:MAG: hypothetical protein PHH97_03765 [Candidatus Cloacimonetes bacterium]|nr:hypothetical protein [Candidatus Cloacimonadota bacterium]
MDNFSTTLYYTIEKRINIKSAINYLTALAMLIIVDIDVRYATNLVTLTS